MAELLYKVENMAQFIELYDDRVQVQMPLAARHVIPLKDITDIEFRRASFFMAGKMTIRYRQGGASESAYYPFSFVFNDGMVGLLARLNELRGQIQGRADEAAVREVIKVRCRGCGALMDEHADVCPVCGRPEV